MNRLTQARRALNTRRMDDGAPPGAALAEEAPFQIARPDGGARTPVIVASPHSGRFYPPSMRAASRLDPRQLRRSEDAHVDDLVSGALEFGHTLIAAQYARAYIDVNRQPWELDPGMFEDELPAFARARTARVAAGLGSVARIVGEGQEIYARKLTFAEAEARVRTVHQPYHAALAALVAEAKARFGLAVLLDWHSMPAAAAGGLSGGPCDMVLGDRFGAACTPQIAELVEKGLKSLGYRITRNTPYAGGYTTEHYGRPTRGVHALQIEINRALYLHEASLTMTAAFGDLRRDLSDLFGALAEVDWGEI
jgi:N-formylglutamate amidohydrolase